MHDGLASPLSESPIEVGAVILGKIVPNERLATIFVNSLQNLRVLSVH